MKKSILGIIAILIFSSSFCQMKVSYEIPVTISGLRDSTIFLAYHFGDKQYLTDTVRLDGRGYGVFSGKELLPSGIYMIVLPGKTYFEVLISDDQKFSLSCSYSDYFNTLKFSGSNENSYFIEYQKKYGAMQQKATSIAKRVQANRQDKDSLSILLREQKIQEAAMKSYLNKVMNDNQGNLLSVLVKSMLPIEVPEFVIPAVTHNPDSVKWVKQYNYNKNHFFDNIDFNDERLLRTPILQARLDAFFTNVVIQSPDSIIKEIDKLIPKCKSNHKVFQFVSVFLFNHFRESEIMGHDAVLVKLADDIYLSGKADWASKEFMDDLRRQVELLRHNLIGMKAENLVMDSYKGVFVSLYDVDKDFTVLYFWEPDCGHCKETTPKLKALYEKAKNEGIEIFAVCTTSNKAEWTKYIEEQQLTWINGWDPERNTHFDYFYNVQSTPMIYILDRNKKIIAKKLSVDDIPSFISNYRKYFSHR
ncbi:MAG: redoxin domain-containing protein [Bacteroidales bacterium]|jgi:thiol-disulfide isomerase/thioredoxin|nr:redoxin domain-containing protein [Bacteroidales bacterium]